jgi:hypothetical protein
MRRLVLTLLAACLLAAAAAAVGVEVRPDRVLDGDTVTIALTDLPNGMVFSLRLEGAVAPGADGTFAFTTTNLSMPFTLETGQVQASIENTATNAVTIQRGDTRASMSGASRNGRYEAEKNISIPAGTYDELGLSGTGAPGATTVRASLALTGIKRGPDSSTITFTVRGVTSGTMTILVYANAEKVLGKEIALGPAPTPARPAGGRPAVLATVAVLALAVIAMGRRR